MLTETYRIGSIIDELLLEMEGYDWSLVDEIPTHGVATYPNLNLFRETAGSFGMKPRGQALGFDARQIVRHSGIDLNGAILEFDTGPTSIGAAYPGYVAIDSDPRNVKQLRRRGMRAIIGTIEGLPIPENSFDYVLTFSPLIIRETRGWKWVNRESNDVVVTTDYREEIVRRAIEIAKKKALIASIPIAVEPPYIELAEKIVADPWRHYYYVVYKAQ